MTNDGKSRGSEIKVGDYESDLNSIIELESCAVGCLWIDNSNKYIDSLADYEFTLKINSEIYNILRNNADIRNDIILLKSRLGNIENAITILKTINGYTHKVTTIEHMPSYLYELRRKSNIFKIRELSLEISKLGMSDIRDKKLRALVKDLDYQIQYTDGVKPFLDLTNNFEEDIKKRQEMLKSGIPSSFGFPDLDQIVFFNKGDLGIIGARTSVGKTSFLLQYAYRLAYKRNKVIYFTTEMCENELRDRIICSQIPLNYFLIRIGRINDLDMKCLGEFYKNGENTIDIPLGLFYKPGLTLEVVEHVLRDHRPDYVIIDYIQQMKPSGLSRRDSRAGELSDIASHLKDLAGEYNCGIFAAAQLSREVEKTGREIPKLSDLKECVTGDTLIFNCNDGNEYKIEDLHSLQQKPKLLSMNPDNNVLSSRYPSDIVDTGKRKCCEITTESGKTIKISYSSKLFTKDGFVDVDKINIGDCIAVSNLRKVKMPVKGEYKHLYKKGLIPWNKGNIGVYKCSRKTARKISMILTGKKRTQEFKDKMRKINPPFGIKRKGSGYILEYSPNHPLTVNGYVPQHRLVIEKHIGRLLTRKEIVHHLDGDKINNKIENLVLCENVSKHNKIHIAMEYFVYELIKKGEIYYDRKENTFKKA